MKEYFVATIFLLIPFCPLLAQGKVIAVIENLKNDKGVCRVCLFNNANAFIGESGKPYKCVITAINNKKSVAVIENVTPGNYALFVFHDANNNNKIDKNFLGMPKEGYGASKNILPFAAAPRYEENTFTVANNTVDLNVEIRNLF
jgi:uncharacterized protein (DUF2141 family)